MHRTSPTQADASTPLVLDMEGAAVALGTTQRHVRKLVETRQLASVKVGRLVRIRPQDIADYIERQTRPAVG